MTVLHDTSEKFTIHGKLLTYLACCGLSRCFVSANGLLTMNHHLKDEGARNLLHSPEQTL